VSASTAAIGIEERALAAATRRGDHAAFETLVERYQRELQVHCYRMVGSLDEAQDLAQETFLRAWKSRTAFEGRSTYRRWLYRIATNACIDFVADGRPRMLSTDAVPAADPSAPLLPPADLPWLEPYPDRLLEGISSDEAGPDAVVVARETIELAFVAAMQHLPARQRAALILHDALGWSVADVAELVGVSEAATNSLLQRARATMRRRLPRRRVDWVKAADVSAGEEAVLRRYVNAMERCDSAAVIELMHENVRSTMAPTPTWFDGREAMAIALAPSMARSSPEFIGDWRVILTAANRQPAAATYLRPPGETQYKGFSLDVLRIEDGKIVELNSFEPRMFPAFGLPTAF
jgi:RNA polymerase sigma-70 factor (ECF subfamily)